MNSGIRLRSTALAALVLLFAAGCSSEDSSEQSAPETNNTDSAQVEPAPALSIPALQNPSLPAATATAVPAVNEQQAEPLPAYPLDAILAGAGAGQWSLEGGLNNYLRSYVYGGDTALQGEIDHRGMEAVVRAARAVVAKGDAGEKLKKSLRQITLPIEDIERYTVAAPGQRNSSADQWLRFFVSPALADGGCDRIVRQDLPSPADLDGPCYHRREWTNRHGGINHRIYYPADWETDPSGLRRVLTAAVAIDWSLDTYVRQGRGGSIYLIFSTGLYSEERRAEGFVGEYTDDWCSITLLDPAYGLDEDEFKQTVAHEVFHCFQAWNARPQYEHFLAGNRDITAWWIEGTAEFFSNVAYPHTNAEWSRIDRFDVASADNPILSMAYESTVFFQYMANRWGNNAVVNLMGQLPDSGDSYDQASRLAGFMDMQNLFHDFAEDYLDQKIRDTSGELLPINPLIGPDIDLPGTREFETPPFVLYRAQVNFNDRGNHRVEAEDAGAPGEYSVRKMSGGDWTKFPERLEGSPCESRIINWRLALTAVTAGEEPRSMRIKVVREEGDDDESECEDEVEPASCGDNPRYAHVVEWLTMMGEYNVDDVDSPHCHPHCTWSCFCEHPRLHSERTMTLAECYRYVEDNRERRDRWLPGRKHPEMTYCEFHLSDYYDSYVPGRVLGKLEADEALMGWCTRRCLDKCGMPQVPPCNNPEALGCKRN